MQLSPSCHSSEQNVQHMPESMQWQITHINECSEPHYLIIVDYSRGSGIYTHLVWLPSAVRYSSICGNITPSIVTRCGVQSMLWWGVVQSGLSLAQDRRELHSAHKYHRGRAKRVSQGEGWQLFKGAPHFNGTEDRKGGEGLGWSLVHFMRIGFLTSSDWLKGNRKNPQKHFSSNYSRQSGTFRMFCRYYLKIPKNGIIGYLSQISKQKKGKSQSRAC